MFAAVVSITLYLITIFALWCALSAKQLQVGDGVAPGNYGIVFQQGFSFMGAVL